MGKYNEVNASSQSDSEDAALLHANYTNLEATRRKNYVWITLLNLFLFTLSMLSLMCAVVSQKASSTHSTAKLYDNFGLYSPAMHAVEYEQVQFKIPSPINSSEYVGTSDDVNNAWVEIAYLPDQMVSVDNFPALQKPADSLKVTDPKTGETGYRVGLEVFHQLHCLNLLRMATYPDYYEKMPWSDTSDTPEKVRVHLDHCVEVLRTNLMCLTDVNVFTFHERPGQEGYWPDYETPHVCRNFNKIKDWALENALPVEDV